MGGAVRDARIRLSPACCCSRLRAGSTSRGNLNPISKILIYNINIYFCFWLEYQLEYCTPLDHPFAFDFTSTLRNHDWQ